MGDEIKVEWTPIFDDYGAWDPLFSDYDGVDLKFDSAIHTVTGGTYDYTILENKPKINGVELAGDKSTEDLQIKALTNMEIEAILNSFV